MAHNYQSSLSPRRVFTSAVRPLTSMALILGWAIAAMPNAQAVSVSAPTATSTAQLQAQRPAAQSTTTANSSLANGVYLYGESTEPEQIGSAYMVFQVKEGKVMGAFYMPRSSFDCFSGEFQGNKLALNVVDTYAQTVHPYAIALERTSTVASSNQNPALQGIGLEGFHRLNKVSDNDQRILGVCQASFQGNQAGK
jgi:hypothetical protein